MPKKKAADAATNENTPSPSLDDYVGRLEKEIEKEFGGGVAISAQDWLTDPQMVIPISPALDIALRGGIPEGIFAIFSGTEKCGKTVTALSFCANAQRPEYGGRHIYYHDIESRIKSMNLVGIKGLDQSKMTIIRSVSGTILSAEDHLRIFEKEVSTHPGCVVILDSTSALCSKSEQLEGPNAQSRHQGPKLLTQMARRLSATVKVNKCIAILIQHLIFDSSGKTYGSPLREDGGKGPQYQADLRLRCKWVEDWTVGSNENSTKIGQIANWVVVTSATGGIPGSMAKGYIRYGIGVDGLKEIVEKAVNLPFVERSGAWIKFNGINGEVKVQGVEKFKQYLEENPNDLSLVIKSVYDTYRLKPPQFV